MAAKRRIDGSEIEIPVPLSDVIEATAMEAAKVVIHEWEQTRRQTCPMSARINKLYLIVAVIIAVGIATGVVEFGKLAWSLLI